MGFCEVSLQTQTGTSELNLISVGGVHSLNARRFKLPCQISIRTNVIRLHLVTRFNTAQSYVTYFCVSESSCCVYPTDAIFENFLFVNSLIVLLQ